MFSSDPQQPFWKYLPQDVNIIDTPNKKRLWLLIAMLLASLAVITIAVDPIPQDPVYHQFADEREILGIPHFNDVLSNIGFAVAAVLGLLAIIGAGHSRIFTRTDDRRPYTVFFIGVALVSIGSGFYHLEPTNERLLWDRLPMSIAFMGFSAAIVSDRISARAGNGWLLALLVALGIASLFYWSWTESMGRGDLRFYAIVQFYPILLLPLILWWFPDYRYTAAPYLVWVLIWYGLSKVFEFYDHEIYALLGQSISGHSLKHLAAAVSVVVVWRMLIACRAKSRSQS